MRKDECLALPFAGEIARGSGNRNVNESASKLWTLRG